MSSITNEVLEQEIAAQLKCADLTKISAKKVRLNLEAKLNVNLSDRKQDIDHIIMSVLRQQNGDDDDGEEEEEEEEGEEDESSEEEGGARAKSAASKAAPRKRGRKPKNESADSGSEYRADSSEEERPKKHRGRPKGSLNKNTSGDGAVKGKGQKKDGAPRKTTGFTRKYRLSPALSKVMGSDYMARHEVIKKMWALIKEKNLYDPKNKQFAYCNDDILPIFGIKRFRTFGMMKHLKEHFIEE